MLTQRRAGAHFLTSQTLTVAIIASVVLVNSVAWAIPLLVGGNSHSSARLPSARVDGSRMTTGTVPRLENTRQLTPKAIKQVRSSPVPLPYQAPRSVHENSLRSARPITVAAGLAKLPTFTANRKPSTLFPRPEPRLELQNSPRIAAALHGNTGAKRQVKLAKRKLARDVVLVSPYTPGVRISPNGRGHEWRHRNLRSTNGQTTLDTAKAIARRAARRFERMRDRMAKLDAQSARGFEEGRAPRRALLPVAPQPPRIAGHNAGRSYSKSSRSFVRPRLIRRPLGDAVASRRQVSRAHASLKSRDTHRIPRSSSANQSFKPRQVARLTPTVRRKVKRSRQPIVHSRIKRHVKRAYRRKARTVRRAARVRHSQRRHRPRKVNGFRRGFHRQLVAANFFGSSN